jgi:outer membrane protein OmpA-like peptidoglycan-associated protein
MKRIKHSLLCCTLLIPVGATQLDAQDAKGCKDSPLITRMPGSTIRFCRDEEFHQADFLLADNKKKHVEGEYHVVAYTARDGATGEQIFRNVEAALKSAGWTIEFERGSYDITAHMGKVWLGVEFHGGNQYDETFVAEKQMVQEVTANAAALSNGLTSNGHAVVNGILFDTGKADVKPESDAALKEVAKLLQQDSALKLYVVGHTDNVGTLSSNVELSAHRAAAVMKALTTQYGVAASRLQAYGDGPYAPVTSNDSEGGRALNRRVELVKQ